MSDEDEGTPIKGKFADSLKKIATAVKNVGRKSVPTPAPTREPMSLEQLIAVGRTKRRTTGDTERLKKAKDVQKRNEILYRLDPLIFSGVNRLRRSIVSPRLFFTGEEKDREAMEAWAKAVGLKRVLKNATQDIIIYGYSIIEKVKNVEGLVTKLVIVDPKTVDWAKDSSGKIRLDKNQNPIGFEQEPEDGAQKIFLPREDIILLNFFTLGPECLGISPLETAFKASWIRLNLEEAYGEAIYRHGYPLYYFKVGDPEHPITPELIRDAKKILRDFDTAQELILPNWIEPGRLDPKAEIRSVIELWVFLAGEVARALDSPLGYITPYGGAREGKGEVEYANLDLEKAIRQYQQDIKDQLEDQLLPEVRLRKNVKTVPELHFAESSPETQWMRMRMISMLSSRGSLHIDVKTENFIRKELDLPMLSESEGKDLSCVFNSTKACPVKEKNNSLSMEQLSGFCKSCPFKELEKEEDKTCQNLTQKSSSEKEKVKSK